MQKVTSQKRLNIDRKMISILSLVAVLGVCLVIIIVIATNSLSALRAYSTLQINWAESRKEAAHQLGEYFETGEEEYRVAFKNSMKLIRSSTAAREELLRKETDSALVHEHLLNAGMMSREISGMIITFERFKNLGQFKTAIDAWEKADSLIYIYDDIANQELEAGTSQSTAFIIERIRSIDDKITQARKDLSIALVEGNALLINILLWGAVSLGVILLGISVLLFFRFSRSIKAWHQQISISEQRYRSLFQQNPHAVFSMDNDGKILQGNSTFTTIFERDATGGISSHFSELMVGKDSEEIEEILTEVKQGNPHSFETRWNNNANTTLYLHNTILPIIVDEKVAGLFGISEDVTFEKNAEVKIKQQLEEKTVLLAEIHHRVKNNLAVISGLLHLQEASLQDEAAIRALTEAKMRIQSIAMIHEKIYQNDTLAAINFRKYIEELTTMIAHSFDSHKKAIDLHLNVEDVSVTLDQSIPCGLIINELICNAYEHAFEGESEGNIWISIKESDGELVLKLVDDGVGLPDNWEENRTNSLGLTLVETLTQQINGTLLVETQPRTAFEIRFSEE